jgi:hypothetical protein
MKRTSLAALTVVAILFGLAIPLQAKDGDVRVVSPSKVEAAKGRLREKTATDWLTEADLKKLNEEKRAKNEQIIFFEYHLGRDKWRGIYTDKVLLRGFSWWIYYGANEMEAKVNEEVAAGRQAAFIARSGNYYSMLFVTPEQYPEARKILDELGIGEPKLKK